jgi:hypothetical protein
MFNSTKSKFILLLFLCALFLAFVASRILALNNQDVYGRLKVVSSPGAGVFIDGIAVGKTPYENKQKAGEYTLKLIPEGNEPNISSWQGKIKVYKNSLTYVNRELGPSDISSAGEVLTISKMEKNPENPNFGEIYVETEPSGAIVYLDNDDKATAPFIIERVLKGDHELSVFMPGFLRRTQKISVKEGYRINASFKLALDPNAQKNLTGTPSAALSATPSATLSGTPSPTQSASGSGTLKGATVTIDETPTGYLRVRSFPSTQAEEILRVNPGETYPLLDEQPGWYKIKVQDKEGWISSDYSTKKEK